MAVPPLQRGAVPGLRPAMLRPTEEGPAMNEEQMKELLYQALQTEMGGVEVYTTALRCVQNEELKEEWEEYLEQTEQHVEIVRDIFSRLGLDAEAETPGRAVVRHIG